MTGRRKATGVIWHFFAAYVAALFVGSFFITLNNILLGGISIPELLEFNIPFILSSDVVFAFVLLGITRWRLSAPIRHIQGKESGVDPRLLFDRFIRFPMELFWGMTLISIGFMVLYHGSAILSGRDTVTPRYWATLAKTMGAELNIALLLSILLYIVSRRLLRPFIMRLEMEKLGNEKRRSAIFPIALTFTVCYLISFTASLRLLLVSDPMKPFDSGAFFAIAGVYTGFAAFIFFLLIFEIRKDLRLSIDRLRQLADETGQGIHLPIPIVSLDETGRLADAFNELQHRVVRSYDEVERQLKLAYDVQERLLPRTLPEFENVEIAALCQQCYEVGGDFYDVIRLDVNRMAVAIGDVSGKGMPAALLMSAMMAGLRAEIVKGGTAADILTRLNRLVCRTTKGTMYATLGLALFEFTDSAARLDYASAGHVAPYLIRNGQTEEWPCSSLPLGIDPDIPLEGIQTELGPGHIFAAYTDGIIETRDGTGDMISFDRWEEELGRLTPDQPLTRQLSELLVRLGQDGDSGLQDDRTVVLLQWHGKPLKL